ncbi:MAG: hypothetical protein KGI41_02410 [Patescibacteria group bacterium]|nr:hypothetical protein [Patescibacteria group bacterium]MDE1966067.1 hypothetical protein [Patescibacteria group bacterium]
MNRDARFYFMNLCADVARSTAAAERGDENALINSRARIGKTLEYLRREKNPAAYEEGLLLVRGFELARASGALPSFGSNMSVLMRPLSSRELV